MAAKIALLLTNLGTPERLDRASVKRFLQEFLSDPLVVGLPRWLWLPLLNGVILPLRSGKTLAAYRRVWRDDGSPLLAYSKKQQAGLQQSLGERVNVALAMRYGNPSFASALTSQLEAGFDKLVVLPLYPQYSETTTATSLHHLNDSLRKLAKSPDCVFIDNYHDHPAYINALAESVREHRQQQQNHLLMSFHGLPQVNIRRGDPYQAQCEKTAELLAQQLGLKDSDWSLGYQSRFGKQTWIQPYTADVLHKMAAAGVNNIDVICPGFSADCLETLDEIEVEYRAHFLQCGGEQFNYIPALNDRASHIEMMHSLVQPYLSATSLSESV